MGGEVRRSLASLFVINGTKSLDEGKLTFVEKGIDFVGRGGSDNSIKGKIELQNFEPNEGNVLTASVVGCKFARYQPLPFYCSQNINKLKPVFENNRSRGLFSVLCSIRTRLSL